MKCMNVWPSKTLADYYVDYVSTYIDKMLKRTFCSNPRIALIVLIPKLKDYPRLPKSLNVCLI